MARSSTGPGPRRRALTGALAMALAVGALVPAAALADTDPRQGLTPGTDADDSGGGNAFTVANADAETASFNMELLANLPKPAWTNPAGAESAARAFNFSNINSDLAFTGDHAISGNYRGFGVYDVSDPGAPELTTTVNCPASGGQNDVSVFGDLLFVSVENGGRVDCTLDASQTLFRGVRIFDINDLSDPQQVGLVQTCRGSHTHTVVEDPNDDSVVYIYVSGTAGVRPATQLAGCSNTAATNPATSLWSIDVIKVPLAAPETAAIVDSPRVLADPETGAVNGLQNVVPTPQHPSGTNWSPRPLSSACHDITAYPAIGLAAAACQGNGLLLDITNPAQPVRVADIADPNFAYWHSATFNNDGTSVVFTDEWGGGLGARCRPQDAPEWGANGIYDIVDDGDGLSLEFASYYKIPNVQAANETCVAHNSSLIPVPGRDVMVQAWYEGGVSVFDFTDTSEPVEIAFFDRGPYAPQPTFQAGGYWSAYWYNGQIYGNEIFLGFDSFGLTDSEFLTENELAAARAVTFDEFNAQAQPAITWEPSFALVRAYRDQAVRDGLAGKQLADLDGFIARAERFSTGPQSRVAVAQLGAVANRLEGEYPVLGASLRDLAVELG